MGPPVLDDLADVLRDVFVGLDRDEMEVALFVGAIDDFYLTNPIARASAVMAECSVIAEQQATLTAAE